MIELVTEEEGPGKEAEKGPVTSDHDSLYVNIFSHEFEPQKTQDFDFFNNRQFVSMKNYLEPPPPQC